MKGQLPGMMRRHAPLNASHLHRAERVPQHGALTLAARQLRPKLAQRHVQRIGRIRIDRGDRAVYSRQRCARLWGHAGHLQRQKVQKS